MHRSGKGITPIVIAASLIVAVAAGFLLPLEIWLSAAGGRLQGWGLLGTAAFGIMLVVCALALVPTSPFALVAGLLFGPWAIALVWGCMVIAAAISLPLARHLLRGPTERFLEQRPRLRAVREVIGEEGWLAVLLFRLSGLAPFGIQNYVLGATQVRFIPYLLATSVGVLPSILFFVSAGAFGQKAFESDGYLRGGLILIGVVAAACMMIGGAAKIRARLGNPPRTGPGA